MMSVQNRDAAVAEYLEGAVQSLNGEDLAGAELNLRRVLALDPSHPVALYLMGVVHFQRSEWEMAEPLFHRALQISPGQPRVIEHLAKAAVHLAASHNQAGRGRQAQAVLQKALTHVEGSRGNSVAAAELHHALGLTQKTIRQYGACLESLARAEALAGSDWAWAAGLSPARRELRLCRASALQHLRRFDDAADELRSMLADNPLDMDIHVQLNELLYRQGRDDLFLASYDAAARALPESTLPLTAKGFMLLNTGRADEARQTYEQALRLEAHDPRALSGLARAFEALGRSDEALAIHERSVGLHPDDGGVLVDAASARLRAGDALEAKALALRAQAQAADDQGALAVLGLCYRALADEREFELNGYDTLVRAFDLEPPEGFADMAAFNQELAGYLDALHADRRENCTQTLRGGTRVYDEIFNNGHELIDRLKRVIDGAVGRYAAALPADPADPAHPFLSRRTSRFAYSGSWSSRMSARGFHLNHIHAQGWISSAYYVTAPDAVADADAQQGWLTFGAPPPDFGPAFTPRRTLQPAVGRLVLFPSYLWHGVIPFRSAETRSTIAFDVVPV
jgi:tetratricopeptide (TPR) repeat protein